jgi:hypothetical protein
MVARGILSFHPSRLCAPSRPSSKLFLSPTCEHFARNSFVSPTSAKTGGCTPLKMSARRHFLSLFSQSPLSTLFPFNRLRTLSFSVSHLSAVIATSSALLHQKPGVHPLRSDQSHDLPMRSDHVSSPSAVDCQLSTVSFLPTPVPTPPYLALTFTCKMSYTLPNEVTPK